MRCMYNTATTWHNLQNALLRNAETQKQNMDRMQTNKLRILFHHTKSSTASSWYAPAISNIAVVFHNTMKSVALQYSCAVSVPRPLWPYQVSGIPTLPSITQTFAERFSVENERHLRFVDWGTRSTSLRDLRWTLYSANWIHLVDVILQNGGDKNCPLEQHTPTLIELWDSLAQCKCNICTLPATFPSKGKVFESQSINESFRLGCRKTWSFTHLLQVITVLNSHVLSAAIIIAL